MFFDALGRILVRASDVLRADVRPAVAHDVFLVQQVDALVLIVGEIGAAWSELFATLERQNDILEQTLAAAGGPAAPGGHGDPLRRNAELLGALDERIAELHADAGEDALRELRRGLRRAAELEQDLLAGARERAGTGATRRL